MKGLLVEGFADRDTEKKKKLFKPTLNPKLLTVYLPTVPFFLHFIYVFFSSHVYILIFFLLYTFEADRILQPFSSFRLYECIFCHQIYPFFFSYPSTILYIYSSTIFFINSSTIHSFYNYSLLLSVSMNVIFSHQFYPFSSFIPSVN